jgi:hypothetical protein
MQLFKIEAGTFHVDGGAAFVLFQKKFGKNVIRATNRTSVNLPCVVCLSILEANLF